MQWGCAAFFSYHLSFCLMFIRFPRSNLLSTRTRRSSIFQQPPWRVNRKPILAAACALVIVAVFFSYVPFLYILFLAVFPFFYVDENLSFFFPLSHGVFKTSDIPARYFLIPMTFALALIV